MHSVVRIICYTAIMPYRIGIDVGGVLRSRLGSDDLAVYLADQPFKDAFEVIRWIVQTFGRGNVFIVSRCSEPRERAITLWLEKHGFFSDDMLEPSHVFFCRERADKAPIVKKLGIDCFIDDRAEVLEPMKNSVHRRIQLSLEEARDVTEDSGIISMRSWAEIRQNLNTQENRHARTNSNRR